MHRKKVYKTVVSSLQHKVQMVDSTHTQNSKTTAANIFSCNVINGFTQSTTLRIEVWHIHKPCFPHAPYVTSRLIRQIKFDLHLHIEVIDSNNFHK